MTRIRPSLVFALAFAIPLAAHPAPAQTPLLPTNNKISVSTEPTLNAGLSDLQVNCEIYGGALYIDRDYAGSIPYTGKLSPGSHYFELDLPGYDAFGLWLTLDEMTEYTIVFNPDEKVPIFATNDRVSVSTEPTLDAGLSDLEIYCEIGGGRLFIDGHDFGPVPSSNVPYTNSISPGSHYIELDLIGYYKLGFWLMLDEKTKYTMTFHPERITSYLSIEVEPADASIRIDGRSVGQGIVKIVEGRHRVEIKRFGYFERTIDAEVSEQATSFIALSLEKAPFAISDLGFDRPVFNPRNVGTRGKTSLSFIASSYGSARAEIFAPDGSLVATLEFPNIETWAQSRVWEGLGPDRAPLPDGVYSVMLTATPAPDAGIQSDARVSASAETRIDSSVVIRSYGTASAVPGLLYMPDPLSQPAGVLAVEASWFAPWGEPQASAIGLSAALSLGGTATLTIHGAAEMGSDPANGGDLAGSALLTIFGDRKSLLNGAVFIRAGYSSLSSPTMPGAGRSIEASLPVSTRIGEFAIALAPGAVVDFASGSASLLGLARSGLWLEGPSFRAGLSAELPISFSAASPGPLWPARTALEGRLMLGSTPFVASCYIDADLQPGTAPRFALGLGLGLLF